MKSNSVCNHTSMITDRIGRHEVLLPINLNFNKIVIYKALFLKSKHKIFQDLFFASSEKRTFKRARDGAYCPIT